MTGLRYFEDYPTGTTTDCGSVSVDQAQIISFARQFDPQPFHVDPVAAADGPFGGLIASGWHTAALVMRQIVDNYVAAESSLGALGLDELRWPHPVRPGDTLRVRVTICDRWGLHSLYGGLCLCGIMAEPLPARRQIELFL